MNLCHKENNIFFADEIKENKKSFGSVYNVVYVDPRTEKLTLPTLISTVTFAHQILEQGSIREFILAESHVDFSSVVVSRSLFSGTAATRLVAPVLCLH